MFRFKKIKNKFIWSNDEIRLEFSKPSIQSFEEYKLLDSIKGILHYYYTVKIFKNIYVDYDNEKEESIYKWKLVCKRSVFDFPGIFQLQSIIEYLLDNSNDITTEGQKCLLNSGNVRYELCYKTEGFVCEDFYELTKILNKENKSIYYNFYMGCSFDIQGDLNSEGIKISRLKEEEIKELQTCVDTFIQYSIEKHNKNTKLNIKLETSNKKIVNDKLYEYTIIKNKISKNIETIFARGDSLDNIYIKKDTDIIQYNEVKIINIDNSNNLITLSNNEKVNPSDIYYIFMKEPTDKLNYDINQIINDFYELMNIYEKKEFCDSSIDMLYEKFNNAIIDRTWMCRSEHPYKYTSTGYPTEDISGIVKEVIIGIKNKC